MTASQDLSGLYFELISVSSTSELSGAVKAESFPRSLGPWSLEPTVGIHPQDLEFDEGSSAWRAKLSVLRAAALQKHEAAVVKGGLEGCVLRKTLLTLSEPELAEMGVPQEATHFAWGHISSESFRDSFCEEELGSVVALNQPDLCFLILGGYLYFNAEGKCVKILAIVPSGSGMLRFSTAKSWPPEWSEELRPSGRFTKPVRSQMLKAGACEMTWISPGETFGGQSICPHGGFAYLFPNEVQKFDRTTAGLDNWLKIKSRVMVLFSRLDFNRSGCIDREELRQVFQALNKTAWPNEKVDKLFRGIDCNLDGKVQYAEFVDWLFNSSKGASEVDVITKACVDEEPVFDPVVEAASLSKMLPAGKPRLCILGGRGFQNPLSSRLVQEVAALFSERLGDRAVVLTGGLQGVQETFAKALGPKVEARHLLPCGEESGFGVGEDLMAGEDMDQRMAIYGQIGDVYLTIEGGPGVAKEAAMAHARGAAVLPMMWTGGASEGMFNFPPAALERPGSCSEEDWAALREVGGRGDDELVRGTAASAVAVIAEMLKAVGEKP